MVNEGEKKYKNIKREEGRNRNSNIYRWITGGYRSANIRDQKTKKT